MIVLIAGLPGSGKSYFASRFAAQYGASYISSDTVRRTMGLMGKYSLRDKENVYKEMLRTAERFVLEGKPVVVDATFTREAMRDLFFRAARKLSSPINLIWIYAQEEQIQKRLSEPRLDSEADYEVYEKMRDSMEQITIPHLRLESSGDNIDFMLKQAADFVSRSS